MDEHGNVRISNNPLVSTSFFDPRSRIPEDLKVRREVWKFIVYTGDVVGREIAERWYRTAVFVVYAEDDLLDRLLGEDVWERGVRPGDVVRHIRLIIPANVLERDDVAEFEKPRAQILKNLGSLKLLGNKKTVIEMQFSYVNVGTMRRISGAVYGLKESGYVGLKVLALGRRGVRRGLSHVFDMERGV